MGKAVRVARAVGPLVVEANDQRHGLEAGNAPDHLGAPLRVQPHEATLVLVEPARLAEDVRGQAQLADVVEERAQLHLHELRTCQSEPLAHDRRGGGDLERVVVGVTVHLGQRLHKRANLGLRVARRQFPVLVMAQRLTGEHPELTQQLHFWRFELSLLVPAADAQCTALLNPGQKRSGGHRAQSRGVQTPPDQVRIGTGSGHDDEVARFALRPHRDPRLLEAENGACVTDQAVEHHARIAQSLRRRHPCRRWGGKPQPSGHCWAVKFLRKLRSSDNPPPHGSPGAFPHEGVRYGEGSLHR